MAPPVWSCDCCCESFRDYTSIEIDGSPVCVACIRRMFDKALKFEHDYPPNWAGPLHPSEFSHILSTEYIEEYKQREIEYKTPIAKRIYCQHVIPISTTYLPGQGFDTVVGRCGQFLGVRQKARKPDHILTLGRCKSCKSATCMVCDDYSEDPQYLLKHECPGKSCANENRAKAFHGLKRGKDWQECPSRLCGRRIELSAACNHMICQCGTGFCFICGKEADGESEHWRKGGSCPRYNQPGDDEAEYDEFGYGDDDDSTVSNGDDNSDGDDLLEDVRGLFSDGQEEESAAVNPQEQEMDPPAIENALTEELDRRHPSVLPTVGEFMRMGTAAVPARAVDNLSHEHALQNEERPSAEEDLFLQPMATGSAEAQIHRPEEHLHEDREIEITRRSSPDLDMREGPALMTMTTEDVDIDHVLWRMRIE